LWKKPSQRKAGEDENENAREVEHELEREGKGARKKTRLIGAKLNISNAGWKDSVMISADGEPMSIYFVGTDY
jgi:hypothetical protein